VTWGYIKTNFVGIHVDDIPKHDPTYGMKVSSGTRRSEF
jgi:hypothetical protein